MRKIRRTVILKPEPQLHEALKMAATVAGVSMNKLGIDALRAHPDIKAMLDVTGGSK